MLKFVKGTYEKGHITLDETPDVRAKTKVLVTFLNEKKPKRRKLSGKKRKLGALKGKVSIPDNFNEPLEEMKEYM